MGMKYAAVDTSNPSFLERLMQSLLVSGGTAAVQGGVQGALGNYFEGKRADADMARNKVEKLDMAERVSNQNQALTERAEVKDFLKDMPDKKRAWTIYQQLKDNPELLTQDLGPVAGADASPSGAAFFQKGGTKGQAAPQVIPQAMNPVEQYAREDPKGFSQWNMGKEARDTQNKGILEGMRANARVDAAGTAAGSREQVANQKDALERDKMGQQNDQFEKTLLVLKARVENMKQNKATAGKAAQAELLSKAALMALQLSSDPRKAMMKPQLEQQAQDFMNQALQLTGEVDESRGVPTMGSQPQVIPEPTPQEVKEVSALPAMAGKTPQEIIAIMKAKRAEKEGKAR